jgi:hypothetical protein
MGMDYDLWLRLSARCDLTSWTNRYCDTASGQGRSQGYRRRFQVGIEVMTDFLAHHRALISKNAESEAWAHTFTARGNAVLWAKGPRTSAWSDYIRAIRHQPFYRPAWWYLLRSLLTTAGSAESMNAPLRFVVTTLRKIKPKSRAPARDDSNTGDSLS